MYVHIDAKSDGHLMIDGLQALKAQLNDGRVLDISQSVKVCWGVLTSIV